MMFIDTFIAGSTKVTVVAEVSAVELDMPATFEVLKEPDIWICDTGASCHSTYSLLGATNIRSSGVSTVGHTGEPITTTKTINIPGRFVSRDGTNTMSAVLSDVGYNEKMNYNLFSLSRMLVSGWHITKGDSAGISIANEKGDVISFDIVVKTSRGAVFAARFIRDAEINAACTDKGVKMDINKAHALLGHGDLESTRESAKALGWTISRGAFKPCVHCAKSKAKQKNVVKESISEDKAEKPGDRVFLDLTTISVPRADGTLYRINQKNLRGIVDQASGKKWGSFSTTKNGMVEPTMRWLSQMKAMGIHIKCIRMDPAGENFALKKECESAKWHHIQPLKFEITSRDTPQHNNLAELAFPYLINRSKAQMSACFTPIEYRGMVCVESIKLSYQLDGLRLVTINGVRKTRDEHVFGVLPKWAKNMRTFGEAGVVKDQKHGKMGEKGIPMMFVGYSDRESDSYRMWNPKTNRVVVTRDVIWLKRYFFLQPDTPFQVEEQPLGYTGGAFEDDPDGDDVDGEVTPKGEAVDEDETDFDEEEESEEVANSKHVSWADAQDEQPERAEPVAGENVVPTISASILRTRSGRTVSAPERLIEVMEPLVENLHGTAAELRYLSLIAECDNEEVNAFLANQREFSGCSIELNLSSLEVNWESALVGAGVGGGFSHTDELKVMNYRQAMNSPDREAWKEEVKNEYLRFEKFKVFKVVKRSDMPAKAKILTTTWAMKKKSNGKLRGRLNARGFEQVEGQHFYADSISSPVTNPVTIRVLWTLLCCNPDWVAEALDVEGAFLQGKFKNGEVIYTEVPDGMEEFYGKRSDVVLLLLVPIYGTKQAANCFYDTLVKAVKEDQAYDRSKADSCLFFSWKDNRLVLFTTWIDDLMIVGHPEDVKRVKTDIGRKFICKDEGKLLEYVGAKCDFTRNADGIGTMKITQPVLVQKLEDIYGKPKKPVITPAVAGQELIRGDGAGTIDEPARVTKFRSGTALCMYMTQWSRPEVQNATRSCARMMQKPREVHEPALERLAQYIISTPERGLVLHPTRKWDGSRKFKFVIGGRTDSNYASNIDDRRSVTGVRTLLENCPVTFRSNTQKFVTLSVTEAETGAGVTGAQDMMYIYRLLKSIDLDVEIPMVLEIDNKGAVDMANNWSAGGRTRHMDVRMHYLRELKDQGLLVIRHISGDDNDTDIFTKNTATATFLKHIPVYVGRDEYMAGSDVKNGDSESDNG